MVENGGRKGGRQGINRLCVVTKANALSGVDSPGTYVTE